MVLDGFGLTPAASVAAQQALPRFEQAHQREASSKEVAAIVGSAPVTGGELRLASVGGALGASLENETAIRHAIYLTRELRGS